MFADLDETLKQLLTAELPIKNGEIDVSFDQPKREWSARLTRPAVNFFLYDVKENATLRRHQWEQTGNGARANGNGAAAFHKKRTPFRLDCFYMLTTWAAEAEDEHRLLARALHVLFRHPLLPQEYFVGQMQQQPYDVQALVARHDRLTNPAEIWSALDNEMRPSISYVVTLALDPWTEVSGPIIRSLTLRAGQAQGLPHAPRLSESGVDIDRTTIGGAVRRSGQPQAGITVAVRDSGLLPAVRRTATDEQGRFRLGALPHGEYTLVAWPPEGKPKEKQVSIPGEGESYDFEL
ncbi:MAG: Pvc16 family protein [Chloroflexota bacterium]